jgi:hypothetical protein
VVGPVFALLLVLAQAPLHRVEASDTAGRAFWEAGPAGSDQWEKVTGHLRLDVRPGTDSVPRAEVTVDVTRSAETWRVELVQVSAREVASDVLVSGPGGWVRAALTLRGLARVSRAGDVLPDLRPLGVTVLTTGYHADDGSFRTLRGGRNRDLEVLVHVDAMPLQDGRAGTLDLGFDDVEVRVDGTPLPSEPLVDASAPVWEGALAGAGVGGSGQVSPSYGLSGTATALSPVGSVSTGLSPPPANSAPATPLPAAPPPGNAGPATPLTQTPAPVNASPATPLTGTPMPGNAAPATPIPAAPPPPNASPATPLPSAPAPANASPATPLPVAPAPLMSGTAPSANPSASASPPVTGH